MENFISHQNSGKISEKKIIFSEFTGHQILTLLKMDSFTIISGDLRTC